MTSKLPGWLTSQQSAREAEDRAACRRGEDGFNAQDTLPADCARVTAAEAASLDALDRRQSEAGRDIFGAPLPEAGAS